MTILLEFDPDTHEPLSDVSAPFMTLANGIRNANGVQMAGCEIIPLPDWMPAPPDGKRHVVRAWSNVSGVNCQVRMSNPPPQTAIVGPGRRVRIYLWVPQDTLDKIATTPHAQIKYYAERVSTNPKGFALLGSGQDFNSDDNKFASRVDEQLLEIHTGPPMTGGAWHEAIVSSKRDAVAHVGTSTITYDGQLQGSRTHAMLGTDDPKQPRDIGVGMFWTQGADGLTEVYSSGIVVSDSDIPSLMAGVPPVTPPVTPPVVPPVTPPVQPPVSDPHVEMLYEWISAGAKTKKGITVTKDGVSVTTRFADGQIFVSKKA